MAAKSTIAKPDRGQKEQLKQIRALERKVAAGKLLSVKSEDRLEIEGHAKRYTGGDVDLLRREIEQIAEDVIANAAFSLGAVAEAKDDAQRGLDALEAIDLDSRWLRARDPRKLSLGFYASPELLSPPPSGLLVRIIECLNEIEECRRFLREHHKVRVMTAGVAGNNQVLLQLFVSKMVDFHLRQIGSLPPKGRTGPFVRLMEDAWRCLGFPNVPETALGNMVAKLPRSAQSFRRRPR